MVTRRWGKLFWEIVANLGLLLYGGRIFVPLGDTPFKERFPRLYSISIQQAATVAEIYTNNAPNQWNLLWRRRLFVWEEELLLQLLQLIATTILLDREDRWKWVPDKGEVFTVNSTFLLISDFTVPSVLMPCWHATAFSAVWKCLAPSKINAFAWQLLHDRIPTRQNLQRRRIIEENGDMSCVLCGEVPESSLHLFIYCEFAHKISGKNLRKGMRDLAAVLEEVKVLTWKWWLSQSKCEHKDPNREYEDPLSTSSVTRYIVDRSCKSSARILKEF
ncbi:putative ribonuclease H protein [Trifolium medium]|uniref:Putative ribonuclease H protein n=1 Tax=Trifolium medium TaxID=97028 RepID=A0A392M0W5_9FABA|nr:putative ribonuclease H protein [Trifolium medium]